MRVFKNSFWPNQYATEYNPYAHQQTMSEIVGELNGKVDYLFCATSTCGTLRGCAEYKRKHHLATRILAVDAVGSVIFGGQSGKRLIPGHGAALVPALFHPDLAEECIHVTDLECILGCHRLLQKEALLSGGSSGAIVSAIGKVCAQIQGGSNCVAIFADRGERYLDSIYSDSWVKEHFGDIPQLQNNCRELSATSFVASK
jgi:cysteine synthase